MNQEIKKKWLKALRSGGYKQTRGKLKSRNGSFCCLGVLCDIQGAKWKYDAPTKIYEIDVGHDGPNPSEEGEPPYHMRHGLSGTQVNRLMLMNDGEKGSVFSNIPPSREHSFSEIADYIEKNL